MHEPIDRRTFVGLSGAAAVALAGCTGGGPTETETPTSDATPTEAKGGSGEDPEGGQTATGTGQAGFASGTTIELGGEVDGWVGRAPTAIKGTTNPPLRLQAGANYTITWENLDGKEHELHIEDDKGSVVEKSDSAEGKGETVTMELTATTEMVSYFCKYHPESMRGDVSVSGSSGTDTATGDGTDTATGGGTDTGDGGGGSDY